jgi:hypothetical protein
LQVSDYPNKQSKFLDRRMRQRVLLGYISIITLILTLIWFILLIAQIATLGPLEKYEQVIAYVSKLDVFYYLVYLNASLTVIAVTLLYSGLYLYSRSLASTAALMGLVFLPVYTTINLFVYLSQISIVPQLIEWRQLPEYKPTADLLLSQLIQQLPSSGVVFFNHLAYGILGIPSIIFGWLLYQHNHRLRLTGLLLELNGITCILGVVGVLIGNELLSIGTVIGGILFLIALIPLSRVMLKRSDELVALSTLQ